MKHKYRRGIDMVDKNTLFVCVILLAISANVASASGLDVIRVDGGEQWTVGNFATVYINVTGADNIGSLQLDLLYDPNIITANNIVAESLATSASPTFNINNTVGKITIGLITTAGISGNGSLVKINYSTMSIGTSKLNISIKEITDINTVSIATNKTINSTLTVVNESIDNISPNINGVVLSNYSPNVGDNILITVNATDNVNVVNVSADIFTIGNMVVNDHVVLVNQSNNTWTGTVTARNGSHSVNVSAIDKSGNVAWNNLTSYTGAEQIVQPTISFNFNVNNATRTINENETATYLLTIENTGNVNDTYNLTVSNPDNATVALSNNDIQINSGNNSTATLIVSGSTTGTYTVNVTATSKVDSTKNKTIGTKTTINASVITPKNLYIKELIAGNGSASGYIIANATVTNIGNSSSWFVIVVSGTNNVGGYPLIGTGTVYLNINQTIGVPILVSIPAGAQKGEYNLYAGIYTYDSILLDKNASLESIKGPVVSIVS